MWPGNLTQGLFDIIRALFANHDGGGVGVGSCASMTKISPRDAAKFHELSTVADTTLDMVVIGIYSMPPSTGGRR